MSEPAARAGPRIAPSILASDFAALGATCRTLGDLGISWIHVDLMDGRFIDNIALGPGAIAAIRPHVRGVLDAHLEVAPADPLVDALAAAGADSITVHVEAGAHPDRTLERIRAAGCRAGIALNPATSPTAVAWLLDRVDLVCVMSVNPGFGGQAFIPETLAKVPVIRAMATHRPIMIQVDGGIGPANARAVREAGADVLVAGSAVFGAPASDPAALRDAIRALERAADGA